MHLKKNNNHATEISEVIICVYHIALINNCFLLTT